MRDRFLLIAPVVIALFVSEPAKADLFGGDVAVLTQILVQSIETVVQLKSILSNGEDTLSLLRDVNSGVRSGLDTIHILNPNLGPGVYGGLENTDQVLRTIQDVYGVVPKGPDEDLMTSQDQSVAETIAMNRDLYSYADQVDRESERIIYHANTVSPQGAGRLQGQAIGVLIGVMTHILRTQSQLLKLTAENTAMQNRKEKVQTQSYQENYRGLSDSFSQLPPDVHLPRMGGDE